MPSSSICKGQSIRIDTGTSRFRKIIEIDFVRLALSFLVGIGNREGENFRIKLNSHLVHSRTTTGHQGICLCSGKQTIPSFCNLFCVSRRTFIEKQLIKCIHTSLLSSCYIVLLCFGPQIRSRIRLLVIYFYLQFAKWTESGPVRAQKDRSEQSRSVRAVVINYWMLQIYFLRMRPANVFRWAVIVFLEKLIRNMKLIRNKE